MFTDLLPILVPARPWPVWLTSHPAGPRGQRTALAPGIWINTTPAWVGAAVFDSHTDLPPVRTEEAEIPHHGITLPEWHTWSLCAGMGVAAFFGSDAEERPTMKRSELAAARVVCAACPVKRECLTWAIDPVTEERHGVWGGTSGRQRTQMKKQLLAGAIADDLIDRWFASWLAA